MVVNHINTVIFNEAHRHGVKLLVCVCVRNEECVLGCVTDTHTHTLWCRDGYDCLYDITDESWVYHKYYNSIVDVITSMV